MIKKIIPAFFCLLLSLQSFAQENSDSVISIGKKMITLSEVVVDNKLNVPALIDRIKNDTSFYKAFRNLHILGFTAINDIRMNDADGKLKAGLTSTTRQTRSNNCRSMQTLEEKITGDIYDENRQFNYYTAQMYASLFFTRDSVCGEDNMVTGREFSTTGKTGMEKNKERLKMLFFNPGKRIDGLPFISNKTAIYDDDMANRYDMEIDLVPYKGQYCYVFKQKVKPENKSDVVIDEMTTWFDEQSFEVVARNYSLSYSAGVYDFNVQMDVEMTKYGEYQVPSLIRYIGNWKAIFKKRERGVFTATLFDFK
ncbi:MAG: hypothetical protein IPL84_11555 [Chitinophagaceae bacterium]|nr:hypothetical protein [Chitinophagaceae bacterium]